MGAPRKHPPQGAAETIQRLAATGFSIIGIAKEFKVVKQTFARWLDESESLQEAFEAGREIERQALHAAIYRSAMEGKPANVNAFFLLKSKHGYVETDNRTKVNVAVAVSNVMTVTDHGTDAEWEAKAAEQQRRLTLDAECSVALPTKPAPPAPPVIVPALPEAYTPLAPHAAPAWKANA